jgi:hypothetical protein
MTNNNNLREVLDTAADLIARHHTGMAFADVKVYTPSFEALESDIYGWGDGTSPIIQWEEGPYEWTLDLPIALEALLADNDLFAEPINTWALGLYEI